MGEFRSRGNAVGVLSILLLCAIAIIAMLRFIPIAEKLQSGATPLKHIAKDAYDLTSRIANALTYATPSTLQSNACESPTSATELAAESKVWEDALNKIIKAMDLKKSISINTTALLNGAHECHKLANQMTRLRTQQGGIAKFHERDAWKETWPSFRRWPYQTSIAHIAEKNFTTENAWGDLTGSLKGEDGACIKASDARCLGESDILDDILSSSWHAGFKSDIGSMLHTITTTKDFNGKRIGAGPDLVLSISANLQRYVNGLSPCMTGHDADWCAKKLSKGMLQDSRFASNATWPRTAGFGIAIAERDSGRILAISSDWADCLLIGLKRSAVENADGNMNVFKSDIDGCAQLPDKRNAWIASTSPAFVKISTGSTNKIGDALSALKTNQIPLSEDAKNQVLIAHSHDFLTPQAWARTAGDEYLKTLKQLGYNSAWNVLTGESIDTSRYQLCITESTKQGRQNKTLYQQCIERLMHSVVDIPILPKMSEQEYSNYAKKYARNWPAARRDLGLATAEKLGKKYLEFAKLSAIAIGGGGNKQDLFGLLHEMRLFSLCAAGKTSAPALHLIRDSAHDIPKIDADIAPTVLCKRALTYMAAITSPIGTGFGAFFKVNGHAQNDSALNLYGKTGSADFLVGDQGSTLIGDPIPAKVFMAEFTVKGVTYVAAAMALRTRDPKTLLLEDSNAAAEAVFSSIRFLQTKD